MKIQLEELRTDAAPESLNRKSRSAKEKNPLGREPARTDDHMVQADYAIDMHEAEITKARNDWKEHPNGESYRQRLVEALG